MTTFLSRPVWDFPIHFSEPTQGVEYDVKPLRIGFGADEFAPTARFEARSWRVEIWLPTAIKIAAYEEFCAALKGTLNGFWFPEPSVSLTVLSSPTAGVVQVRACGLVDHWDAGAPFFLWLVDPTGVVPPTGARVLGVSTPSAGVEEVTISAAISPAPGWYVSRLLYCLKASPSERYRLRAEHFQEREVVVVEAPDEYGAVETGDEPVFIYKFTERPVGESAVVYWFTSFAAGQTYDGNTVVPLAINHGELSLSDDGSDEGLELESVLKAGVPWDGYQIHEPERPLELQVIKIQYGETTGGTVIFSGELGTPEFTGRRVVLPFTSWLTGASRVPSMQIGRGCHYTLGDPRTCKVDLPAEEVAVTLDNISDYQILVGGAGLVAQPEGWFARGQLVTGTGATQEVRAVLGSTVVASGQTVLIVNRPLRWAGVTDAATLTPGCDRKRLTCKNKFGNLPNYPGFDEVPGENPVTVGPAVDGGGVKK